MLCRIGSRGGWRAAGVGLFGMMIMAACGGPVVGGGDSGIDAGVDAEDVAAVDAPGTDGAIGCSTAADCPSGLLCLFSQPGCSQTGHCAAVGPCGAMIEWCGCDGVRSTSCSSPTRAYVNLGPCR